MTYFKLVSYIIVIWHDEDLQAHGSDAYYLNRDKRENVVEICANLKMKQIYIWQNVNILGN
jgi:hypothetical protein